MIDNATEILRAAASRWNGPWRDAHPLDGDDSPAGHLYGILQGGSGPRRETRRASPLIDGHHPVSAADTYPAGYAVVNETRLTLDAAWFAVTAALSYVCVDFTAVNGGDASYEYQLLAEYPEPVENHAFRLLATVHFANGRTIIRQQHHGVLYANIFRYCSNEV